MYVKNWKMLTVLGVALVLVGGLFPFHLFLPSWNQCGGYMTLDSGESDEFSVWFFKWGETMGSVEVYIYSVGDSDKIQFSFEDSRGLPLISSRQVFHGYKFECSLQDSGYYYLYFSNPGSFREKLVIWNIRCYYYNLLFKVVGGIILVLGFYLMFREKVLPYFKAKP